MKSLIMIVGIGAGISYFVYALYWKYRSISKGIISGNEEEAVDNFSKSLNWISLLLLAIAIICIILYRVL